MSYDVKVKEEVDVEVKEEISKVKSLEATITKLENELLNTQTELKTALSKLSHSERHYEKISQANEDLRKENERLSQQLHEYRTAQKNRVEVEVQTDEAYQGYDYSGTYQDYASWSQAASTAHTDTAAAETSGTRKVGDLGEDGMPVWDLPKEGGEDQAAGGQSLAEGLKAAANEVLQESGVVFHEESGLYYDYGSGYYFDPERSLYYEPHSGTYYFYDHEEQAYKFHSQVDLNQYHNQNSQKSKTPAKASGKTARTREANKKRHEMIKEVLSHISDRKERRKVERKLTATLNRESKDKVLPKGKGHSQTKKKNNISTGEQGKRRKKGDSSKGVSLEKLDQDREQPKPAESSNISEVQNRDASIDISESDTKASTDTNSQNQNSAEQMDEDSKDVATENGKNEDPGSEMEEGEISSSEDETEADEEQSMEEDDSEEGEEESEEDDELDAETKTPSQEEETTPVHYAPCVRIMVTESDCLDVASLFIMTCTGGTIGREQSLNHAITVPDLNVSKAKKMSAAFPVGHGDVVKVGGTSLELHIHPGTETCDGCEPGQVLARLQAEQPKQSDTAVVSKEEREKLRRQQLKNIKRKFGLENMGYEDNKEALANPSYQDKAEERRRKKGSDNPYQPDDAPASVHRPISETNKGHKLLAKMGWKEGQGLGREEQGLSEPVQAEVRAVRGAGLGSAAPSLSLDAAPHTARAAARWGKAQQRFDKLQKAEAAATGAGRGSTTGAGRGSTTGATTGADRKDKPTWVKGETLDPT